MSPKLNHLEGLRGLCCTIVVIDHCFNHFAPWLRFNGDTAPLGQRLVADSPLNLVYSGIPAVYIFFLMSGFVLSFGFFRAREDYLEAAFLKRVPRLVLPCVGAAIFFFLCHLVVKLTGNAIPGARLGDLIVEAIWKAPALGEAKRNGPLWTISWEIYGSFLVFALLACFGSRKYFGWICAAVIAWFANSNYLPFMIGMATCYLMLKTRALDVVNEGRPWIALAFLAVVALSLLLMSYPYQREGIVIPEHLRMISWSGNWMLDYRNNIMAGSILFFLVFMVWKPLQSLFTGNILVFLGKISFSAYLLHIPVIWTTDILLRTIIPTTLAGFFANTLVVLTLTLIAASLFERIVDRPAIRFSSALAKRIMKGRKNPHANLQKDALGGVTP